MCIAGWFKQARYPESENERRFQNIERDLNAGSTRATNTFDYDVFQIIAVWSTEVYLI